VAIGNDSDGGGGRRRQGQRGGAAGGGERTGCELIHLSAAEGYGRRQQRRQVDSGAGR
jgi:hypothetical protein